jgi:phenylpyruvate tautomerase PptA (4-oxalocrotonate tautomerase family)
MLIMPLLKLETTVVLSEDKRQALLASLSKTVAETIGKPQQYVMVTASQSQEQASAACRRKMVVSRMLSWPASIFWIVRGFTSTNSASFSWVSPRETRSRRTLAPNLASSGSFGPFRDTPY